MARLLIYALGSGYGHLNRALSLARVAARRGHRAEILTNSAVAQRVVDQFGSGLLEMSKAIEVRVIDHQLDRDAVGRTISARLQKTDFDVLMVDTFPRGLGGELASVLGNVPVPRVLVHRNLSAKYVQQFDLADFCQRHYQLILAPGEAGPLIELAQTTKPWLICEHSELLTRDAARRRLGVPPACPLPCVVVMGAGRQQEARQAAQLAAQLSDESASGRVVRFCSLHAADDNPLPITALCLWPLLALHAGIDLMIGSGGYNTVHECRATGLPLLARAHPRMYDSQVQRLSKNETLRFLSDIPNAIPARAVPSFEGGASEAMDLIQRLL